VSTPHPGLLAALVRNLAVLALPVEDQVSWLRSLGLGDPLYADELALELNDGLLLSAQFQEAGWLGSVVVTLMAEIEAIFSKYDGPGHDEFWNLDGLRTSPDWARIRELALAALFQVGMRSPS